MQEVRAYLDKLNTCKSTECKTIKYGRVDKKLISKTGYCTKCLAIKEFEIRNDGLWEAYETYKITSNMISYGMDVIEKFKQAYSDVKQEYEIVGEDGKIEKWTVERDIEELKAEILSDIEKYESEIQEAIKLRDGAWDLLKDKNYDLVSKPNN
jgi:nicotinic acid mononucleotide adenylyltransferase